jgi:hypothetical protein
MLVITRLQSLISGNGRYRKTVDIVLSIKSLFCKIFRFEGGGLGPGRPLLDARLELSAIDCCGQHGAGGDRVNGDGGDRVNGGRRRQS